MWAELDCPELVLPGQTDVTNAVGHVAVTGKRWVQRHRFRLLARHWCPCRERAAFRGDKPPCDDVVRLCRFYHASLKLYTQK